MPDTGEGSSPDDQKQKSTWAKLIKKVNGIDPFVCPRLVLSVAEACGYDMKILAVVLDPEEVRKIMTHLVKIGRAPPDFEQSSLN